MSLGKGDYELCQLLQIKSNRSGFKIKYVGHRDTFILYSACRKRSNETVATFSSEKNQIFPCGKII